MVINYRFDTQAIKESFYRIEPNLTNFWRTFFDNVFIIEPDMQKLFRHVDFENLNALATRAITIAVKNLNQPSYLKYYLRGLGEYQFKVDISEVYFPVFEQAFLEALETYHLNNWNQELENNWREFFHFAFDLISDGMTDATLRREFEEFMEAQEKLDNYKKAA
ncbi:globin domain-containing protein [Halobacteriovorax sp. YZS-1-1]|uniref:globin domain-containing protein n=1 Tax=unclassified Halobacteriovorax TaxID=2639665 RepID=UPI00399BAA72